MKAKDITLEAAEILAAKQLGKNPLRSEVLAAGIQYDEQKRALAGVEPVEDKIYRLRLTGQSAKDISLMPGINKTPEQIDAVIADMAERSRTRLASEMTIATLLECDRLEAILKALWPAVVEADLGAIDRILIVSRERRKLLNLDAPEMKVNLTMDASQVDLSSLNLKQIQAWEDIQKTLSESKRTKIKTVRGKVIDVETSPVPSKHAPQLASPSVLDHSTPTKSTKDS